MKLVKTIVKTAMMTGISVGALTQASIAYAQQAPSEEEEAQKFDNDAIIVTATKREQTLQEIPVAVSVTSAETIEKAQIRDLIDLQTAVPTLRVSQLQSSANTNFIIRGFGNGANNAGIEPSVGVFIDGVYRSRSASAIGDLPNLQRIEVLRGPQSTLFGKNASAGVISIVTQKPQFTFGGSAELSYGNYNAIIAKADVTGPLSDTVAASISGSYNRRDGYAKDLNLGIDTNERNRWGTRGQLYFEPNDKVSLRIIADYDKIDEICCVAGNVLNGSTGAIVNALALSSPGGVGIDAQNPFSYDVYTNVPSENNIKNYGFSSQLDYDLGGVDFTSITSYRVVDSFSNQDSDFSAADLIGRNSNDTKIDTYTQEIRFASDFDGMFNFLLGGYYFKENIEVNNQLLFGTQFRPYGDALIKGATSGALGLSRLAAFNAFGAIPTAVGLEETFGALEGNPTKYLGRFFANGTGLNEAYGMHNEAFSLFGTVDLELTDRLTLTGGFNFTKDKKEFGTNVQSSDAFAGVNFDNPLYAPLRFNLIYGGALAGGATPAQAAALATANQNNPAANPLNGLKALQFLPAFLNVPNSVEDGKTDDSNFSYTVRAAYEINDNLNVYASYATGFKASSVNLSRDSRPFLADRTALTTAGLLQTNQSYGSRFADPEKSRVIEVGIKGQWDVAAANLTIFEQSIKGFQSNVFTGTGFALANAGQQTTFGIEFDGSVSPTDNLTFSGAVVYLDSVYDSFTQSATGDISGTTPSGIPGFSMTLGAEYNMPIGENELTLRTDYHYESPANQFDFNNTNLALNNYRRTVNALNASLTYALGNGFQATIWGRNLTGAEYLTTLFPSVAQTGSISGYPNQPRTYGISAKYKF
ncbi:TonB-dependent receptor [Sphingorhabdus lutea]|uniref:TonB-dependent receptor n=1 Tax=Sphingorhabdus lutea TaxID=1913578 RepID=A0A1L3JD56_9SPHN|nr:TonB-dependent receptor [Sphingorhabdus lutea]APG63052.1 TonB-dependent receptor [Sphingorhabdus lutea]